MCGVQLDGQTDEADTDTALGWGAVQVKTFNKAQRHQTAIQLYMKNSQNPHIVLMYKCYKTLCNPGKNIEKRNSKK